jgi:hypothetical protein
MRDQVCGSIETSAPGTYIWAYYDRVLQLIPSKGVRDTEPTIQLAQFFWSKPWA